MSATFDGALGTAGAAGTGGLGSLAIFFGGTRSLEINGEEEEGN